MVADGWWTLRFWSQLLNGELIEVKLGGCLKLGSVNKTSTLKSLLECSKIVKKTPRSVPNHYSGWVVPSFPFLPLTYPLSFHFMLPFFHTQLLQRRQRRNLFKIRCGLLFCFDIQLQFFSTQLSKSGGTAPEDSVLGFRFRPPQVSMDTTSLYSTTKKRIAVIPLPLHFASF